VRAREGDDWLLIACLCAHVACCCRWLCQVLTASATVVPIYHLENYGFGTKEPQHEKDTHAKSKFDRMERVRQHGGYRHTEAEEGGYCDSCLDRQVPPAVLMRCCLLLLLLLSVLSCCLFRISSLTACVAASTPCCSCTTTAIRTSCCCKMERLTSNCQCAQATQVGGGRCSPRSNVHCEVDVALILFFPAACVSFSCA
jgi:hypothetical protein